MKKISMTLMGIILVMFFLLGCEKTSDVSLEEIKEMLNLVVDETVVEDGGSKALRRFIGVNPNEVEGFIYYVSISSMDVEEILVIEVKNSDQLESIETLIELRVENQINRFSGYNPNNCGLLEEYELKVKGNYLFFTVSTDVDTVTDAFLSAFRK